MLWDPDGAGPAANVVVFGGTFNAVGSVAANNIAVYDPASGAFSALGTGMDGGMFGGVNALTTLSNGDLVAGGQFTSVGGVTMNRIARWNGSIWSPLGTGLNDSVTALAVQPNGDLVAAGLFTTAGGGAASRIARWNGTAWAPLGTGLNNTTYCLAALPNGDLIAGGFFATAGGIAASRIARWDGTAWSALGTGINGNGTVNCMLLLPNGDLLAGGNFQAAGGVLANNIARWDGAAWSPLGAGLTGGVPVQVSAVTTLANGDVVAGGMFTAAGGGAANYVARWDGSAWSPLGTGVNGGSSTTLVSALTPVPGGDLFAGGRFTTAGGIVTKGIALWNGAAWSALGPGIGMGNNLFALLPLANGDLVAGGNFTVAGSVVANYIAQSNGSSWSPLGTGMNGVVQALTTLPNGDLVAGGQFTVAGGVAANRIARWDGTAWSPLGTGLNSAVYALTTLPNGDLIAGGSFTTAGGGAASLIARWDGTAWSPLGTGIAVNFFESVNALSTLPNGDVVAGGSFTIAGGVAASNIARWNGSSWSSLGTGVNNTVNALTTMPNGDVVAGGQFTTAGGLAASKVARWNGSAWSALGTGTSGGGSDRLHSLTTLPNGNLVVGGDFTIAGGINATCIARWNGTAWSAFGTGLAGTTRALAMLANGELAAGGDFTMAGGNPSAYFARLATTCPATATTWGTGCPSSGGNNTLVANTPPWVDATFHSTGTGLPTTAIVVATLSFTAIAQGALPLSALLPPLGVPGCDLLVQPDLQFVIITTNGIAQFQAFLPNTPPLVGLSFYHQMVPIEFDTNGNWVAITATNALQLTAGMF